MENQTNEIKAVRVITHNGAFHADEVFAVALLDLVRKNKWKFGGHEMMILNRSRNLEEIAKYKEEEPETFILDVGGKYDPDNFCFDHHHNGNMPATNLLLFDWLQKEGKLSFISEDKRVLKRIKSFLFGISDFDTNNENILNEWKVFGEKRCNYNKDVFYRTVSDVISGFNRDINNDSEQMSAFHNAKNFAETVLENEIYNAKQFIKSLDEMEADLKFDDGVLAVFSKYNMVWKDSKRWFYAIMPNTQGYMFLTIDSEKHPLPSKEDMLKVADDLIFRHEGNFIAVFKTEDSCKKVYDELLKIEF